MFWESSHYYINDVIPYRQEVAFEYFVFFSPQNDLRLLFPSVSDVSRRPGYTTTRRLRRTRSWEKGWITSSDQKQRNATSRESSHGASDVEKHLVVVFVVLSDIFSCLKEREMMRNSRWGIQNKVKQILASDVLQFTHSGSCVYTHSPGLAGRSNTLTLRSLGQTFLRTSSVNKPPSLTAALRRVSMSTGSLFSACWMSTSFCFFHDMRSDDGKRKSEPNG